MEENLILEGLLSMVTELKEKQEAQVTPASRGETLERLNAIEQALSELHSNPAVPEKDLQAIQSQLDEIRNRMQGQQKHIEDTKKIVLETYRCFKVMIDVLGSCKTDKEEATPLPLYQRIYNKVASWICPGLFLFSAVLVICFASIFLNVCLAERMQQLQDNDIKYRYLLMQGQADGLDSEVDLNGDFYSGNCRKGVCVTVDGELYSVKPETTEEFFQKEILGRLNA